MVVKSFLSILMYSKNIIVLTHDISETIHRMVKLPMPSGREYPLWFLIKELYLQSGPFRSYTKKM